MYTPPFARTCANTNTVCWGVCYQYRMSHRSLPTCWIDTFIDSRRFRRPTRLFVAMRGALRERVGRHYSRATADCERVSSGVQSVAGVCTVGCKGGTTPSMEIWSLRLDPKLTLGSLASCLNLRSTPTAPCQAQDPGQSRSAFG